MSQYVEDEELKALVALALRNAFWKDFSALVNVYLEAAEGLDIDKQEMMMGELTQMRGKPRRSGRGRIARLT